MKRWLASGLLLITSLALAAPPLSRPVAEILAALDKAPVNSEALAIARKTLAEAAPTGATDAELAQFHWRRARASGEIGLLGEQIKEMRRVIELGGANNPARAWKELAIAEFNGGNFRSALEAREKAIALTPPQQRGQALGDYAALSDLYRRLGDFSAARQHANQVERSLAMLRRSPRWEEFQFNWQSTVEEMLARNEFSAGHYAEAEARFRRALDYREEDNRRQAPLQGTERQGPPLLLSENIRDGIETWLSLAILKQGRLAEAEVHARNAALRTIGRGSLDSMQTCKMLQNLVTILTEANRLDEALALIDRVASILDRLQIPPTAYFSARNHRLRAGILTGLQRWPEALREFEAAAAALAVDPQLAEAMGTPSQAWVRTLLALEKNEEALLRADQLYRDFSQRMGTEAFETAEALGFRGAALAALQRDAEALTALRQALVVIIPAIAEQRDRSGRRFLRLAYIIENYLVVLARVRGGAIERSAGIDAAAEAFFAADALRGQAVQQAMAASATRAAAGSPELAKLARRAQDARQERDARYAVLADLMSRPMEQAMPQIVADLRKHAVQLDATQRSIMAEIGRRFPAYADLMAPKAARIADIQAVLKPGEALFSALSSERQTFVWAIPAVGAPVFAAVPLGRQEIAQMVDKLRLALDPGAVELDRLPIFDASTAHRLYASLLEPVRAGWENSSHLLVATGGALARLPFAVLLTAPPPSAVGKNTAVYGEYRDWPWLIRRLAISQLPAASSLPTLRRMPAGSATRQAFAGFGDPEFSGSKVTAGQTRRFRALPLPADGAESSDYSRIAPLPETREEILALATTLKADPQRDVFLGKDASRDQVLHADLAQRKVVAFATHGLLSGEFPGVDQPALALANPGQGQHGLLTLDDILGLKLDADWVVLSACNTAAGGERGGEAISGLGRGFFYAGSRALLVTHWPVETVSAKHLVVGVFSALSAEPGIGRAEALRRAMLAVMRENTGGMAYAHPLFWAPYALIGDGGE